MTTLRKIAKIMEEIAELQGKIHAHEVLKEILNKVRERETSEWIWNNKNKEKYRVGGDVNTALFEEDIRASIKASLSTILINQQEKDIFKLKFKLKLCHLELKALQKPAPSMLHQQAPKKSVPDADIKTTQAAKPKALA